MNDGKPIGFTRVPIILGVLIGIGMSQTAHAQLGERPISIGYYGHYLIQPGVKIGTHFDIDLWGQGAESMGKRHWFVSPQVGFYARPGNETSLLVHAEVGYWRPKVGRPSYRAVGLGLGYLAQSEVLGMRVRLSDGATHSTERELRHFFMPTLNYEWGRRVRAKWGWYVKYAIGRTLSSVRDGKMVMFVELGVKLWRGG